MNKCMYLFLLLTSLNVIDPDSPLFVCLTFSPGFTPDVVDWARIEANRDLWTLGVNSKGESDFCSSFVSKQINSWLEFIMYNCEFLCHGKPRGRSVTCGTNIAVMILSSVLHKSVLLNTIFGESGWNTNTENK